MSALADAIPEIPPGDQPLPGAGAGPAPAAGQEPDGGPPGTGGTASRLMIATGLLTAHPANVRADLDLGEAFCASIAQAGVRIPLQVTYDEAGGFRVIEGHRRLAAAVKAGLAEVPCDVDPGSAGDEAGQFLDMLIANGDAYRKNFTPAEEADALFAAHEAGATRTRLRKATGRKAAEIKTALAVGGMSSDTRAAAGDLASQLTLEDLSLLAEFDGDQIAIGKLLDAFRRGYTAEHVAERIRQDRAEAAEHDRLAAGLQAAGVAVTDDLPDGAARLSTLAHDGQDLTAETHAACPGRGVYFPPWNPLHPVHYCASPAEHGHTPQALLRPGASGTAGTVPDSLPDDPPADTPPDPGRKLVVEGNRAWRAACEVRKRWIAAQLFARRAAPREAARFTAAELLRMPDPLRTGLAAAPAGELFSAITGQAAASWLEICDTTTTARLPLLPLGPVVTAYEQALSDANTWRTDRYSLCSRRDASRYLMFLASVGYPLAAIEQAVADGHPYAGEDPAEPIPGGSGTTAEPGDEDAAGQTDGGDADPSAASNDGTDADPATPDSGPHDTASDLVATPAAGGDDAAGSGTGDDVPDQGHGSDAGPGGHDVDADPSAAGSSPHDAGTTTRAAA
jgi:ParB family chromosome partitioning protein